MHLPDLMQNSWLLVFYIDLLEFFRHMMTVLVAVKQQQIMEAGEVVLNLNPNVSDAFARNL